MKVDNFLEELKKYLKSTSKEKVLADWTESEKFDQVGFLMEDFLKNTQCYYKIFLKDDPIGIENKFNNANLNPKFTSGFLFLTN